MRIRISPIQGKGIYHQSTISWKRIYQHWLAQDKWLIQFYFPNCPLSAQNYLSPFPLVYPTATKRPKHWHLDSEARVSFQIAMSKKLVYSRPPFHSHFVVLGESKLLAETWKGHLRETWTELTYSTDYVGTENPIPRELYLISVSRIRVVVVSMSDDFPATPWINRP